MLAVPHYGNFAWKIFSVAANPNYYSQKSRASSTKCPLNVFNFPAFASCDGLAKNAVPKIFKFVFGGSLAHSVHLGEKSIQWGEHRFAKNVSRRNVGKFSGAGNFFGVKTFCLASEVFRTTKKIICGIKIFPWGTKYSADNKNREASEAPWFFGKQFVRGQRPRKRIYPAYARDKKLCPWTVVNKQGIRAVVVADRP